MEHILDIFGEQQLLLWSLIDGQAELKRLLNREKTNEQAFDLIECMDDILIDYETRVMDIVPIQLKLRSELIKFRRIINGHEQTTDDSMDECDGDELIPLMDRNIGKADGMNADDNSVIELVADYYHSETIRIPSGIETHRISQPNKLLCDICNRSFDSENGLSTHSLSHSNRKFHKCYLCDCEFPNVILWQQHMKQHDNRDQYACKLCPRTFAAFSGLKRHMSTTHSTDQCQTECSTCGKVFKFPWQMRRHAAIHSDLRPYWCNLCGSTFRLLDSFRKHWANHDSKNRSYACDRCPKTFIIHSRLKRHKETCHSDSTSVDS